MSYILHDDGGSGAASEVEELIDENAVVEHDGRAETRTFFYTAEAPERRRGKFRRMYRHQEGVGDPDRRSQNRPADRRRLVGIFCSRLDMSEYHRERVTHIMEELQMSHMAHYSSEQVILAIVSLVANEDGRFIRDEDDFRTLVQKIGTDLGELKKIRKLIRRKADSI